MTLSQKPLWRVVERHQYKGLFSGPKMAHLEVGHRFYRLQNTILMSHVLIKYVY